MTQLALFPELFVAKVSSHRKTDDQVFQFDLTKSISTKVPNQVLQLKDAIVTLGKTSATGREIRELLETTDILKTKQDRFGIFQYYTKNLTNLGIIVEKC